MSIVANWLWELHGSWHGLCAIAGKAVFKTGPEKAPPLRGQMFQQGHGKKLPQGGQLTCQGIARQPI